MKTKIKKNIFLAILVTFLSVSVASAAGLGNNSVVLLKGTDQVNTPEDTAALFAQYGLETVLSDLGGALCFDQDLINAKTGNVIGTGTDCLSAVDMKDNGGMSLTATTFFNFPGGTIVTTGLVTVQPKFHGLEEYTHVVGAAPQPNENNVIYGNGKFKNAAGSVRLSGLVNLDRLFSGEGIISFDCVFIIDVWK